MYTMIYHLSLTSQVIPSNLRHISLPFSCSLRCICFSNYCCPHVNGHEVIPWDMVNLSISTPPKKSDSTSLDMTCQYLFSNGWGLKSLNLFHAVVFNCHDLVDDRTYFRLCEPSFSVSNTQSIPQN